MEFLNDVVGCIFELSWKKKKKEKKKKKKKKKKNFLNKIPVFKKILVT